MEGTSCVIVVPPPIIAMGADAHELVDGAKRGQYCVLFHDDVSRKCGTIYEHGVVADLAVVSDVRVGHDEGVVSDAGDAAALFRASTDGDGFADDVVVADLEADVLSFEGDVLRFEAKGGKGEDAVVLADLSGPVDDDVRNDVRSFRPVRHRGRSRSRGRWCRRDGPWHSRRLCGGVNCHCRFTHCRLNH